MSRATILPDLLNRSFGSTLAGWEARILRDKLDYPVLGYF